MYFPIPKVTIKWVSQVSMYTLQQALLGACNQIPFETIQALDVVLRHLPSMKYTPVGRSFFSPPDRTSIPLEGGREVWFGFHQSIRPSQWKMMLNIDGESLCFLLGWGGGDFFCTKCKIFSLAHPLEYKIWFVTHHMSKLFQWLYFQCYYMYEFKWIYIIVLLNTSSVLLKDCKIWTTIYSVHFTKKKVAHPHSIRNLNLPPPPWFLRPPIYIMTSP